MHKKARFLLKIWIGILVPKPVDMERTASHARDDRTLHDQGWCRINTMQTIWTSFVQCKAVLHETNTVRVLLGVFLLTLGTAVYLLDRSWQHLAIAEVIPLTHAPSPVFGVLGGSLPSFAHVCAFALLTAALLDGGRRLNQVICVGWLSSNVAFELGQHPTFAASLANAVPAWFAEIPILDQTPTYFLSGTFDPLDLFFATLGAVTAYMVLEGKYAQGVGHET